MSQTTVLKSFAELAEALNLDDLPAGLDPEPMGSPDDAVPMEETTSSLAELLAELEAASATLSAVARRDQEARMLALRDLERYDRAVAQQQEAEQARERAQQVRCEAEGLMERAFAEDARASARRVAALAAQAEAAATRLAQERRQEVERLASQLDLEQILEERQRQEAEEKAKAAEAEKARRLFGALAQVKEALEAGRLAEAQGLLGPVASEYPDDPEVASLRNIIAQRELTVKVNVAEEALWAARREYRREPTAAIACLEAVEVRSLPEPLARQVFGEWARACARLCRERGISEPLRYAPDPGCGAVIGREQSDGAYVVVSALGMGPGWRAGTPVSERQVRRARPLR
ncbi:MAG: hypothetical protein HY689_01930 [Chloroflexi bacterium]|nr:hypothetical protein [Chloroflexota bacterium]